MNIRGVLFDFDGTLTEPGTLDFPAIRRALGCPAARPILEFIQSLPAQEERDEALRILDSHEFRAAASSQPNRGAEDLLEFLRARGIRIGIVSRNSLPSILRALENFERIAASDFEVILSRDDPFAPKPSPDGIRAAAERMRAPVGQLLVVGDFIFDVEAGRSAGAITAYVTNGRLDSETSRLADCTVADLVELKDMLRLHLPLPAGKLPNLLLAHFLEGIDRRQGKVLIAPGVGEDAAAVDIAGEEVLVLKSDPITYAADAIGWYSVDVNANDIAACGAVPRYLLATLLLPPGTSAEQVRGVMSQLKDAAARHQMVLCGGHTEITDAVCRPVVVAQAVGTAARAQLLDKRNMRAGDRLLLTKGVAIEGTSILAREFPSLLRSRGLPEDLLARCQRLLLDPGISILAEARIAACCPGVTAMHDITEGGLATAVEELSHAGGHRIRVRPDRIPVLPETREVCTLLGIHPAGLIGSGALLITCAAEHSEGLMQAIRAAGIAITAIGEVLEPGNGIEALTAAADRPLPWPHFETDEIARIYERYGGVEARRHE